MTAGISPVVGDVESAEELPIGMFWRWPAAPWGPVGLFILLAIGYGAGSRLAILLIERSELASVFFIPAGLTAALLLRTARRHWAVIALAVLVMEGTMDLLAGYSTGATAGYVAGNVIGPLIGAAIVRRRVETIDLARFRHVGWFFVGAVLVGPALSAAIGSLPASLLGEGDFPAQFWQWWLGDALGVLLVGSAILVWGSSRDRRSLASAWGMTLIAGTVFVAGVVLVQARLPLLFLVLVGVATAGTFFGPRAVAVTAFIVGAIAAADVTVGDGRLVPGLSAADGLIVVQFQLTVFTMAGLVLAAEAHERELASTRARQAEVDSRTAAWLQNALLPDVPAPHPGVDIAATYRPGSDSLLVGGDWYDFIPLSEDRIAITIGDVVGHGLEATTSMGRLRIAISVLALETNQPGELLSGLDRYARDRNVADFATASFSILDTATGMLTFASAGHPPMLLVSPTGDTTWLDGGLSPPLHTTVVPDRNQASIALAAGSLLVGYSDGLVERRNEELTAGLERLRRTALALADRPVAEICDRLVEDMGVGAIRDDDVVVVVLRFDGPA